MDLGKLTFQPFPLRSIEPLGWLSRQLRLQADGLSGHLDEFWPDVRDSAWIGGDAEGWERMPYWLDGAIPLAWLLDDSSLKSRIARHLEYIVEHQQQDGWLGPRVEKNAQAADLWSQILALKVLVLYHDASGDDRTPRVIEKALRSLDRRIDTNPLSRWGQFRWFEALIAIWWLYEKTREPWLLDLAVKLHAQGFDWKAFFSRWPITEPTPKGRWSFAGHVVNNAMAMKGNALWWRLTGDASDRIAAYEMIEKLDRFHGAITGVFMGDECLAGTSPVQGTEFCAVVEYMYSLEVLLSLLGDPILADRWERIAFNALRAVFSPDMLAHQYDQQVNQVECSIRESRTWTTNGADANIFGLEPDFGCCTANLSQGWPKFAAHLWMRTQENGIAAVGYAPSRLETEVSGIPVRITLETGYPFRNTLAFHVKVKRPVSFPLLLRIPAWAREAVVEREGAGAEAEAQPAEPGTFHRIEREWRGETRIVLTLPMRPELSRRPGNSVSILRGPLVYALKIAEDWRRINTDKPFHEPPHSDWEVYPKSAWNYALQVDESSVMKDALVFTEHEMESRPFSPDGAPVSATVKGRRVPEWISENGSAQPVPASPVRTSEPLEELTLIPYGCSNLRITEFPVCAGD